MNFERDYDQYFRKQTEKLRLKQYSFDEYTIKDNVLSKLNAKYLNLENCAHEMSIDV